MNSKPSWNISITGKDNSCDQIRANSRSDVLVISERGIRSPEEQWALLLSIATRYDFDNLRERAIQGISSLVPPVDPVRKIELAVRYDVVQWLEGAYVSLCTRPHPLTPSEAARVGPNVSRKVGRCRAEWVTANRDTGTCQTPKKTGELAKEIVRQVFWPYGPAHSI